MTDDPRRGLPSASAIYRIANCLGSQALINSLRATGKYYELPSQEASSGIRIHRFLELDALGGTAQANDFFGTMNNAERAVASKAAQIRNSLVDEFLGNSSEKEIITEKRFWYRQGLKPRFSGQPDFIIIKGVKALTLNFKTGRLEAENAADNLQLRTEAVLLKHNRPELEEIHAAIVEPLVNWDSERIVYDQESLAKAEAQILNFVNSALWAPDKRTAGRWCAYCPGRAYCREAFNYVQSIPNPKPEAIIQELPRGEAGTLLWEKIKLGKKLLETLEETYERILQDEPDALPGYILPTQGRERRFAAYPRKLKELLSKYLTEDEIDRCADFHLSKIEELFGLKYQITGNELRKQFRELINEATAIRHDRPFIRPVTKKEKESRNKLIEMIDEFTK